MINFSLRSPLRNAAGGGDGGGGTPPSPAAPPVAPPAFDLAKFTASVIEGLKPTLAELVKPAAPPPDPAKPDDAASGAGAKDDPRFTELQRTLEKEKGEREKIAKQLADAEKRSEEKERLAAVSTALAEFQFASADAAADARQLFFGQVQRTKENGALVAPDGTTDAAKWIREQLEGPKAFFLAPKAVAGSGAASGGRTGKPIQIEDIKLGMTAEQIQQAKAEIAALLGSNNRG
jgi:hypothetical protein